MQSIFRFQPGTKLLAVLQAWPPGIDYFGLAYQTRKGRVVAKCVQREDNGQIKVFAFGDDAATLTAEGAVEILHDLSDGLAQQSVEVSCCSTTRNQRLLDWWVSALSSLLNQGEEDIDFFESFR
jgi:hypothetical protein